MVSKPLGLREESTGRLKFLPLQTEAALLHLLGSFIYLLFTQQIFVLVQYELSGEVTSRSAQPCPPPSQQVRKPIEDFVFTTPGFCLMRDKMDLFLIVTKGKNNETHCPTESSFSDIHIKVYKVMQTYCFMLR